MNHVFRRPQLAATALVALSLVHVGVVRAEPEAASRRAHAEQLDEEATALLAKKRYADACPKFEESYRVSPGTGVLLRLAWCYELSGRTASAWTMFGEAAKLARASGDVAAERLASRRAGLLEGRVSRLQFHVRGETSGLTITRDGQPVEQAAWVEGLPLDPGTHTLEARAPGRRSFTTQVTVGDERSTPTLTIDLPPAWPAAPSAAGSGGLSLQQKGALALGGAGLAALTVGSLFGWSALGKMHDARAACDESPSACEARGYPLRDDARSAATVSTLAFGFGAAALAGGVALWLTAPNERRERFAVRVVPALGAHTGGMRVDLAW